MSKIDTLLEEARAVRGLPSPPVRRALRVDAGLSLARVADALGVSVQAVCHWELGSRQPRPANALAYSELLDALGSVRLASRPVNDHDPGANRAVEKEGDHDAHCAG